MRQKEEVLPTHCVTGTSVPGTIGPPCRWPARGWMQTACLWTPSTLSEAPGACPMHMLRRRPPRKCLSSVGRPGMAKCSCALRGTAPRPSLLWACRPAPAVRMPICCSSRPNWRWCWYPPPWTPPPTRARGWVGATLFAVACVQRAGPVKSPDAKCCRRSGRPERGQCMQRSDCAAVLQKTKTLWGVWVARRFLGTRSTG